MLTRVQAFEKLRTNLELTGLQEQMVAKRQENVRSTIERELSVVDSFLTGSYRRQTLIAPLARADVDIVVVLDRIYKRQGPRSVLELVRKALLTSYPKTAGISRNGQAVTIKFSDFTVDVVPVFIRPWWALDEGWDICDSGSDSWIATHPKRHVAISGRANKLHDGQLVPRIKELKVWNRAAGLPLRSFHIEVLAWSIFGKSWWWYTNKPSDWESASYFFKKAQTKLQEPLSDPAGTGKDVGAYLRGATLETAVSKAESAYDRCVRAEEAFSDNKFLVGHETYSKIFGNYYPYRAVA
jgi:hypothetical protein